MAAFRESHARTLTGEEFVEEMHATLWQLLSVRDAALAHLKEAVGQAGMPQLLRSGMRQEMEAAEIAAHWVGSTLETEAKLAFARQAGDEARHYMLLAGRLGELTSDPDPASLGELGRSKLYRYFETLETTVERVAAGQFAREAIGCKANELFIAFCEGSGDHTTADLYRVHIQPDEMRHHEWGRELLAALAVGKRRQAAARKAILTTLELADELRSVCQSRLHVETLPGS
jgi:hypothetical protein